MTLEELDAIATRPPRNYVDESDPQWQRVQVTEKERDDLVRIARFAAEVDAFFVNQREGRETQNATLVARQQQ